MKVSSIAVALAERCIAMDRPQRALRILHAGLQPYVIPDVLETGEPAQFTEMERIRAVAIATKEGKIIMDLKTESSDSDAENIFRWAADEAVEYMKSEDPKRHHIEDMTLTMMSELELPSWATKVDVSEPFQVLAPIYLQRGDVK